jgi:hypothetical protein
MRIVGTAWIVATLTVLAACGTDDGSSATSSSSASGGSGGTAGVGGSGATGGETGTGGTPGTGGTGGTAAGSTGRQMTFFVTSVGNGPNGGNFDGLEGADAFCQSLADAVGAGALTWRAYLSTSTVDARDRIGPGPWYNAALEVVATDLAALHASGIEPARMLTENGASPDDEVPGAGHDILTGSNEDGTAHPNTCNDWTSNANGDDGRVGHHDWSIIPNPITPDQSWNDVHNAPCNEAGMINVLGIGRLYCFALP